MDATRTEAWLSAKERDCVRNVRAGRFAVTVTSFACSFDEQRRYDRQLLCQRFVLKHLSGPLSIARHPGLNVLRAVAKLDALLCARPQEADGVTIHENKIL
jgi:hypothetical protein